MSYNGPFPQTVPEGATGRATLTNHGVLVGAGTSAVTQLSVGTNGQVLVGASAADPAFATLTSTLGSIAYTTGANSLNIDIANYATGSFTPTFDGAVSGTTTYSTQQGLYIRLENLVYVSVAMTVVTATGTGNAKLGGLPYTINANCNSQGAITFNSAAFTWPAGTTSITASAQPSQTYALVQASGSSTASSPMQMTNGATTIVYTLIYNV